MRAMAIRGLPSRRGNHSPAVRSAERSATRSLSDRIARLPENVQPFLDDFREHIGEEAKAYVASTPRPKTPGQFKAFVAGFLARIAVPLDLVQHVVIAAAYRWPLPHAEGATKTATALVSAGTAGYGQTIAYGSALTATAGALTVGVVGEIVELYAVASARTAAYQWAGLYPGEEVIAGDLEQILGSKHMLAAGTRRHVGDEYVTALLDLLERSVIENVAVPLVGPLRGGYRSFRNVGLAFDTPLTRFAGDENNTPPSRTAAVVPAFRELLARFGGQRTLPPELGWS
jgi:hypothetical protein